MNERFTFDSLSGFKIPPESYYKEELALLYNKRIESLYAEIVKICKEIKLSGYSHNLIQDFIHTIDKNLEQERSKYFEEIMRELATVKAERKKLEQEVRALKQQLMTSPEYNLL